MRTEQDKAVVELINPNGVNSSARPIILICEHASNYIPGEFNNLGLNEDTITSHVASDIGAYQLAKNMSAILNATLISPKVSRLIYDCNRAPYEPTAIPEKSEVYAIPGNINLDTEQREDRLKRFYRPFHDLINTTIAMAMDNDKKPIIVTIHTFTPNYFRKHRSVEIGVIHDKDSRFADNLLKTLALDDQYNVERNQPYGADDAVTHTLKEHAIRHGLLNVMIEVRNDLVEHDPQIMAGYLSENILTTLKNIF